MRFFKTTAPTFLIVKMSSLGDVLLSLNVAKYLKTCYPESHLTWVIEERLEHLVRASPYIDDVIACNTKLLRKTPWKIISTLRMKLRRQSYDVVMDLQGNCKSAVMTLIARSQAKVGWGKGSIAEWPNLLVTHHHIEANKELARAEQYLAFAKKYMQHEEFTEKEHRFYPSPSPIAVPEHPLKLMVCPGSRWANKQLSEEAWLFFLKAIDRKYNPLWVLIWGSPAEQELALRLSKECSKVHVLGGLSFPAWQEVMQSMHVVISMDSCALHLAGLSQVPTFSIYGASSSRLYKPAGRKHQAYQGSCPYGERFTTRCRHLRTCPTGACIKQIDPQHLVSAFDAFLVEEISFK